MTALKQYIVHNGQKLPYVKGSKGCFIGGTQISMADGTKKPIEKIRLGDLVLSFNKQGELGPASVTETHTHKEDQFITIIHWKGQITVTPNHWILVEDGLLEKTKLLLKTEKSLLLMKLFLQHLQQVIILL